jgi:alpha-2-macroglobulin
MVTRKFLAIGLALLASLSISLNASAKLPALAESRPTNEAKDIDEQQAFLVRAKGPISAKEFVDSVFCEVEGVRSVNNVRVIGGKRKEELLSAAGISNAENWIAFRCTQNFPAGADVIIRWDSQANTFQAADYLRFTVRSGEWLEFTCLRENKESDCNPLGTMTFNVNNRALDPKDVNRFRLRDDAGKLYRPYGGRDCTSDGEYACNETIPFTKLPPETRFTIVVPPGLKESGSGTPLELKRPITFRTSAYPPLVKFARSFGILERNADPALPITVRNLEPSAGGTAAVIRKLRITSEQDMIRWYGRTAGFQKRDRSVDEDEYDGFGDDMKGDEDLRARSLLKGNSQAQTIPLPKSGGAKEFEVVGLPLAEPGLHVVEAESTALGASLLEKKGSMFVRSIALTTNLVAHVKTSNGNAFVWVTRLSDAGVVADAAVRMRTCKGAEITSGKTDKDGVVRLTYRDAKRDYECPNFVFASSGDDVTFTRTDWTKGIESWRFSIWEDYDYDGEGDGLRKVLTHTILARNLLRPGETVHMKHFARDKKRFGTGAPDIAKLPKSLTIVNEGSNERSSLNVAWTQRGNAVTELRLPQNAKRGQYRVEIAGRTTARFTVADFRLPVYKSEVSTPNANVVSGDKADVDVRLEFLSGGPAAGDKVTVRSRFDPRTWNGFENFEDYSFNPIYFDEETGNRRNRESKQPEGEDQTVALSQAGSARVSLATPKVEKPHALVADVEYNDPNGEIYTAQTRLTVWPSSRLIGIKALDWAMSREQLRYEIVTTDVMGKAVGGMKFKVKGTHRTWDAYRKRNIGGFYSYESSERKSDLGVLCEGMTDRNGKFTCMSSVKVSGEVQLNAEVADDKGRTSIAGTSLWASNGDDWIFRSESSDRIDLLPEKKRYEPNEKARFQVRMPFREATALVTVEREGVVLSNFVTQLSGKSAVIEVPMKEEWAPNAFVSALLVRGRVGEPKPTALIDLAKPAFKLGIANVDVNWKRYSLDVKVTTDKPEYQTRDKAQVKIKVDRSNNKRPGDNTEVVVFAIDEALLELQSNNTWKLIDTIMRRRGHDITNATAQMQVIGKRHFGRKALPPGGSGGRGAGARELFDTLIFWKADVMTDANGEATVEVPLNDSLTRFRIVAIAERAQQNEADRFGTGEASIRTTRDLQLFSGLPKIMRHGDDFRASVTLRNSTQRAIVSEAMAEVDGQPLQKREVRIAAGESALISWEVKAAATGAESVWKFDANEKGQARGDSLRVKQALQTPLPIRTVADATAEIKGKASITLKPDVGLTMATGAIKDGELIVSLARVYGADTSGIRGYFARYPFACLEQRTTKALGLKDEGLWSIISESLPTYLSSNGLANYYPGATEEGYPVLTAFVLSGAHEAGWKIPDETLNKMLYGLERYVSGELKSQRAWLPNDSLYLLSEKLIALEALSRYGRASKRLLDTVRVDPVKLTVASLADWIDILNRAKDLPNRDTLRAAAIKELRDQIRVTANVANVARADDRWYFMRSEDYSVARMFRLSLDTPEFAQFKLPLLRQLNSRMLRSGHFWSTQANIWAAFALERHAKQASADGRTRIMFRGETKEAVWDANVLDQEVKFAWNGAAAQAGEIAIEHLGKGEPWARAQLRAAVPLTGTQNNGIALSKTFVPVQQKTKGKYSVGDVLQVTVTASNTADLGWLAIDDPVPTGATVLGGLSKLGNVGEASQTWQGYRYIERTFTNVRSSFEYATKGKHSFTYELRLTTPGKFALPPTHAEAMYAPEVNGQLGNPVFEIEP